MDIEFDNTYATLPERFFERVKPEGASAPETVVVNESLARKLEFDATWLASDEGAAFVVGNHVLQGSEPIALVYAGHQFGNWVPRLGDGRALLLGEVLDEEQQRFDLQLKGSGRTPYSRSGDGRAPLGPVLREYLIAESMMALGIPTTRALAAATTGDTVYRDQNLPGAVLLRVAKSHLRIGTFEYFASQGDREALNILVDYAIDRHYPTLPKGSAIELFRTVAQRQAELVAQWQQVGFIHGVMNTDNMLLSAETIDYGPCAFMNEYDPETVYSSIDRFGRYAYGNQPPIAQWNLSRFAQSLVLAAGDDEATQEQFLTQAREVIEAFPDRFREAYQAGMAKKLGLHHPREQDWELITDLLEVMFETGADYTLTFRGLTELISDSENSENSENSDELFALDEAFDPWLNRWRKRLDEASPCPARQAALMAESNPVFIPRNHRVNQALDDAVQDGNFEAFNELLDLLAAPYRYRRSHREFAKPPTDDQKIAATFCGT